MVGRCWGLAGLGFSGDTWLNRLRCGGQQIWFKFHCLGTYVMLYTIFVFLNLIELYYSCCHFSMAGNPWIPGSGV